MTTADKIPQPLHNTHPTNSSDLRKKSFLKKNAIKHEKPFYSSVQISNPTTKPSNSSAAEPKNL